MNLRSGQRVGTTTAITNLLMAILAPWVTWEVNRIKYKIGIPLPDGYDLQVLGLIMTVLGWGAGFVRMQLIKREEAQAEVSQSIAPKV